MTPHTTIMPTRWQSYIRSELRLVTDLQTCIKAQQNRAYAKEVELTNLLELSRTVIYIQEHGFGSRKELYQEKANVTDRVRSTETVVKNTEAQIRKINETILYAGQYYANKSVHREYIRALFKSLFRKGHEEQLGEIPCTMVQNRFPDLPVTKCGKIISGMVHHLCSSKSSSSISLMKMEMEIIWCVTGSSSTQ